MLQATFCLALTLLKPILGEPAAGTSRTCVSGELCVITGIAGTGLANGDFLAVLPLCGVGPALTGMPGGFGESLPATSGGTHFIWPGVILVDGGEYRLCWCSTVATCTGLSYFTTDIGTLVVTGPISGLSVSCVSGHHCVVANIDGVYLQDGDSIMILTNCGGLPIDGFPNGAKTNTGALQGREHGWGEAKIAALGGDYALCWCAKGATCSEASDHRKELGTMQVQGPFGSFSKVCGAHQDCTWSGLTGQGLLDGDRIMLLKVCGVGPIVPGFPNADIAIASGGGSSYSFGASDFITAGGGEYAMCWCQPGNGNVCTGPTNFLTNVGILIVTGAASDHDLSCVQGFDCQVTNFRGVGLADGDQIQVLLECGTGSSIANWPNQGIAVATGGGSEYLSWQGTSLAVQFGNYRICWCMLGWDCTTTAGFKMDAGALRVVGINPGQSRSCHVGAPCQIDALAGSNLRTGDLMKIMTTCGSGDEVRFPNNATSLPATNLGQSYSWGITDLVEAQVGDYKMCWCPFGNVAGCAEKAMFVAEAGTLTLRGPVANGFNASCVAGQSPECVVGPFQSGVGLTYGADRIALLSEHLTCGNDEPDIAGGVVGKEVGADQMLRFAPSDLPYGGTWKMCYCASYDSNRDQDALQCQSTEDYPATAGFLTVLGAFPDQIVNCTRNQACTFDLQGNGLNSAIHRLALRDQSVSCGDGVTIDTATRRRRDVTANPYTAVGVTLDGYLTFSVDAIQALDSFVMCFCVPATGGGLCSTTSLNTYQQSIGILDIRGATPNQAFTCGRGGRCTLDVLGRGLSVLDRVKIVNMSTDCTGEPNEDGFFKSLLIADPAPASNSTSARFSLGQVTAGGTFKVCYCASFEACNSLETFNHQAGELVVVDPLSDLSIFSANVASITIQVHSALEGTNSRIRCATSEYEPSFMPSGADIANGLFPVGVGQGEATDDTQPGQNFVEIYFKTFVKPSQQYRVWCVEGSAQSFILPPTPSGHLIFTATDLVSPRLQVYPSFLWPQAAFYAELYDVFPGALSARRLATSQARVQTSASPYMCNQMLYADAVDMLVRDAGTGQNDARLVSSQPLEASAVRLYVCFFASALATGIALVGDDRLTVQKQVPTFSLQRLDGLILQRFYRGVLLKVHLDFSSGEGLLHWTSQVHLDFSSGEGLLHWTSQANYDTSGCATAARAGPEAQTLSGGSTGYFRAKDSTGFYYLCYLGVASEASGTSAPMNSLGAFQISDVIHSVTAETNPSSTRSLLRLKLEVRMPGTVTCIARNAPGNVAAGDFSPGVLYEGRSSLLVPPVSEGLDPEFPREFSLELPLVEYQRQGDPMRVWCLHSLAEDAVFPANSEGAIIPLQSLEPSVASRPVFLWSSAKFRLTLSNTPAVTGKLLGMHAPALPFGWTRELAIEEGQQVLRYLNPNGVASTEHPRYLQWLAGERVDLCLGANVSNALSVDTDLNSRTSEWFVADAEACFICFWESPSSFPHLLGKLEIRAQAPERLLQVVGQFRPFVYRGSDLTLRLRYGAETGGRLLVIKKALFDAYNGNCQDLSLARRLEDEGDLPEVEAMPWPRGRHLQSAPSGSNCTSTPRKTSDLKLIQAEEVFPTSVWGELSPAGGNCSDFRLYWSSNLELTSILADQGRQRYILVTSNASVLELFVQRIRSLTLDGQLPQGYQVVVHKDFSDISKSIAQHFVASTADCAVQLLLDQANPMYEEGAENLPLSQYLQASLDLKGFDFQAVAFLPGIPTVIEKQVVCPVLQPPAPPPERQESIWDIDQPGIGRRVVNGEVFVPALMNGTGSFLHSEPLGDYVACYAGDDEDPLPIFNRIGPFFPSVDVLSLYSAGEPYQSNSLLAHVNVTADIPGRLRCLGYLDTKAPPQVPQDVFVPTDSLSLVGESDLIQYDIPATKVVTLRISQQRVAFLAPAVNFAGAAPSIFVWCAHDGSTVLYPNGSPLVVNIQARQPPSFIYKQFNTTVTSVDLTLQLEFTPIVAEFSETFPKNYYDQVDFRARPALPAGLTIDTTTGAIGGIPVLAGAFQRSLVAISLNPPRLAASYDLEIRVKDVLGPSFTSASADNMLVSIQPRSTNIFQPQKAFLLVRKRTNPFTDTPEEFFCLNALRDIPFRNITEVICTLQDEVCCCASYVLLHVPVQDLRLRTADCSFLPTERYHIGGLVEGLLQTSEGVARPARLHSSYKVYATMPPQVTAQDKKPVRFDLVILMPYQEYAAQKESLNGILIQELTDTVFIPKDLVEILSVEESSGDTVVSVSFYVEPRCLQELGPEAELLSFGINTKEGCNLVAPLEYMNELKTQVSNKASALFYQDLVLLNKVHPERSFSFAEQHFCNKEPLWEFGAVAATEGDCPFDLVKVGSIGMVAVIVGLSLVLSGLGRLGHKCGCCLRLAKVRILDILTPILGLYTTGFDYVWLFYLQGNNVHPLHVTLFMACLCNLFLCFVVNAAVLRLTLTSYIIDTPWWRKNRKRLRLILLLSVFSPRFFRITNSHIAAIDRTHIHFGTPSKMAVVFANLGLATLLQDLPLLLVQVYVWLIWRNLAPKVTLLCFGLCLQSILTTILHYVFSRSQRAAYERVVKLLGVRRLTAGFFDVSATVGQAGKGQSEGLRVGKKADDPGRFKAEGVDPTKLDPIQAAMYVAQMYDKRKPKEEELFSEDSEGSKEEPLKTNTPQKTLYPPNLYEKMRRFYAQHDPTKLTSISRGNVAVDEAALDAELKSKFGVGLESVQ